MLDKYMILGALTGMKMGTVNSQGIDFIIENINNGLFDYKKKEEKKKDNQEIY